MVSNCGTCQHWDRSNRDGSPWGACEVINDYISEERDQLAVIVTDGGGDLITKADFGCVLWRGTDG